MWFMRGLKSLKSSRPIICVTHAEMKYIETGNISKKHSFVTNKVSFLLFLLIIVVYSFCFVNMPLMQNYVIRNM